MSSPSLTRGSSVSLDWQVVGKFDRRAAALADRHYSRRTIGSPQFMPPGETLILFLPGAVWGWWRPHPASGLKAMNGFDGWTCTIFRNESSRRSSELIILAEKALVSSDRGCGPSGMITYVWPKRIRSNNPGCCFKKAGWVHTGWSADKRKMLFQKSFDLAGVWP